MLNRKFLIYCILNIMHSGHMIAMSGTDALYQATAIGDYPLTQLLLEKGSPANGEFHRSTSPLFQPTKKGFKDIVNILLAYRADPCLRFGQPGITAWHVAVSNKNHDIIDMFLEVSTPHWDILIPAVRTGDPTIIKKILDHTKPNLSIIRFNSDCLLATHLLSILATEHIDNSAQIADLLVQYGAPTDGFDSAHKKSPLALAILYHNYSLSKTLISRGAHLEIGDARSSTSPIFIAVEQQNFSLVELLLQAGANPNIVNENNSNETIAHNAVCGSTAIMKLLLKHGADVNSKDRNDITPLMRAVIENKIEMVKLLVEYPSININYQAPKKAMITPLHEAAYHGYSEIVQQLISHGANPNITNTFGRTALHDAVLSNDAKTLASVLQARPSLDVVDEEGKTPLYIAVCHRWPEAVDMLLAAGANPNIAAKTIYPLHSAAYLKEYSIARSLLKHGAHLNVRNFQGRTPLHDAALNQDKLCDQNKETMVHLLLAAGGNPQVVDCHSATPLYYAVLHNNTQAVKELLDAGSDHRIACNTITPLHEAAFQKNIETSRMLLEHGANVHVKNYCGRTPLHDATLCSSKDRKSVMPLLKLLVAYHSPLHEQDNQEKTALSYLVRSGQYDEVKFLLSCGAHATIVHQTNTPLHDAALSGKREMCELLLTHGAYINAQNENGTTPLHNAAINFNIPVMKLLIEKSARVDIQDNNLKTPADVELMPYAQFIKHYYACVQTRSLAMAKHQRLGKKSPAHEIPFPALLKILDYVRPKKNNLYCYPRSNNQYFNNAWQSFQ